MLMGVEEEEEIGVDNTVDDKMDAACAEVE